MKRRNRTWGYKRIAERIALAFGVEINKDVVRRIFGIHFRREAGSGGPSWLSFIGHAKDSLWSLDLFRCESAILRTYWVLVVMDQFTRRIVGFAVQRGIVDGVAVCGMFNRVIHTQTPPKYLSSDHDPLYRFHQWQANLPVLEVKEVKSVPYVPRAKLLLGGTEYCILRSLRDPELQYGLGGNLEGFTCCGVAAYAGFPFLFHELAQSGNHEFALLRLAIR
jgi:hypothetical protein